MPNPVSNSKVEDSLRSILSHEGFNLTPKRAYGQTGVDIVARKEGLAYHIEVIGYKQAGPARAKDFYESFFRAVSRLNDGANHAVLALSHLAKSGLPARAKQHRIAWLRIADCFPELEIWLVDTENRTCEHTTWREWALKD